MYHVYALQSGRPVPHSRHGDRGPAERDYWQLARDRDAALVRDKDGELSVVSASVPFVQADPGFRRAVEESVGRKARFA